MILRRLRSLAGETRGAALVEFALVAPVLLLMLLGFAEFAYEFYVKSTLTGAVQKAGRDSTIQGASDKNTAIDQQVMNAVWTVAGQATYTSSRKSYASFGAMAPEPFTDANGDGVRQSGECFSDVNGNGVWDADPSTSGLGGASDISVYSMTITFPRLLPIGAFTGMGSTQTLTASTVLKNQPYATQATATVAKVCT